MRPINLNTKQGTSEITDANLQGREVLIVSVEGTQYDVVYSAPTGRQVWTKPDDGKLTFDSSITFQPNAKAFALTN
jgi:hypothetical protein